MVTTAVVAAQEEKDNQTDHFQETGIFVKAYPKPCSCYKYNNNNKNNSSSMLFYISTLMLSCLATYLPQQCLATSTLATTKAFNQPTPPPVFECGSIDIRNSCDGFYALENCTVITGYLDIVFLPLPNDTCDFNQFQFKNLREITGFFIFYEVKNLTNITNMFPNLTVIRGRQLLLNYAFTVSSMPHLERLEFRSLVAIQRGHVLIKSNPKLCSTEGINWDRLTLRPGENSIFLGNQTHCPAESKCKGCPTDYCWSNQVCQKFESNSVLSMTQNIHECHPQCLGGCYNNTAQGCVVCKNWTDHGTCVSECPRDKYAAKQYLRCYTQEECLDTKKLFVYKNTCVESCPGGYELNIYTGECDSCADTNSCLKVCNPFSKIEKAFIITHLMNVEMLRGCQILNNTVLIALHNRIDEQELVENLKDVREIIGHLKIARSPHLTSLKFFENLQKIHGSPLENNQYSLVIYNNNNLTDLWDVKTNLELLNGGMYIDLNRKLCNRVIKNFREKVNHDKSKDSFQTSDQEVLCSPAKLNLYMNVLSHRSIKFTWSKEQTSNEVEIIYRPIAENAHLTEKSEFDIDVCRRINWRRELKFPHELIDNSTHYSYIVTNLESHTKYAAMVKTFGHDHEARSEVQYVTTEIDIPKAPMILIKSKTYNSLQVQLQYEDHEDQLVDFYRLEVYALMDDKNVLDTRNYCRGGSIMYKDYANEDYDDCCSRREEEAEDRLFLQHLQTEFHCSLDQKEYCEHPDPEKNNSIKHDRKAILSKRLEHRETTYTIRALERFHLYVIQVQACNHAGCGSHNMISTRTNYSLAADKIYDLSACKVDNRNEYRVHFSEPKVANGYITSYTLHFHYYIDANQTNVPNHLVCLTRLEHERNGHLFVGHMSETYNQAAVRVFSLGHQAFTDWINITSCPTTKLAGRSGHGWNTFLIFFLIGAAGTMVWICYKRKYWRKIPHLRRFLPLHMGWRYMRPAADISEDRQILVDGFETVRFHNSPEDDMKYLVH